MSTKQQWIRRSLIALSACALLAALVWANRPHHDVVAKVERVQGEVARDYRGREGAWQAAGFGDELSFGDALKTSAASTASVLLVDGSSLELQPSTVVRFLANQPSAARFRVDTGLAMFQAGGEGLSFATGAGFVRVDPRSRVRFSAQREGVRLEVSFGRASFIDESRASQVLSPGDELVILRGSAPVLKRASTAAKPKPTEVKAEPPLLASNELIDVDLYHDGVATDAKRVSPSEATGVAHRADLNVRAGESVTIHHQSETTAVRLRVEDACDGKNANVELAAGPRFRHAGAGTSAVVVMIRPGVTRYRVRCADAPNRLAASGVLRLVRDAAVRRVPLKPPTNTVDLDGRRYTVLYQNRLPTVVARFPGKAAPQHMRLVVQSGSHLRTYEVSGPSFKIVSGQLDDGEHQLFFESLDGHTRSPTTALRIAFDNAAPTASFDQRGAITPDAEGHAHVSGVVPQGAHVSLEGQALSVDPSGRFSGSAVVGEGDQAVALRVDHPHAGTHYYVRRVAGEGDAP